jgi:hypothetical protein
VVAVMSFIVVERQLRQCRADTGETRRAVDTAVAAVQALRPNSLDAPSFRQALEKLCHERYVVYVWLIRPEGQIAFSNSAGAANRGSVEQGATEETRRVLSELPEGFLTPQQRVALLAASAIQSEGEHNDIFRQMIRPLQDSNNGHVGFIGVAYAAAPDSGAFPGVTYAVALFLIPIGLLVYWLALPWWVWLDAKDRGEKTRVWAMFVLLGNLVALFAYLLTRRPSLAPSGHTSGEGSRKDE